MVAAKSGEKRVKTRFAGVYTREIQNKRTGKPDVAFDISYRDQDGKKVWQLIGYKSDGVNAPFANQKRGTILEGISRGEKPKRKRQSDGLTYAEAWTIYSEKWLPNLARPEDEKKRYKRYLEKLLGHRRLDAITPLDLEDVKRGFFSKNLSPATVRLILGDVRRVYRKLTAWGLYDGPIPTANLELPKPDNARTRFLTEEEALKLLTTLKKRSETWHNIAFLSLYTGMRKGEVLALRGEHLDFTGGRILVKDAKTGSRIVHMTAEVAAMLERIAPDSPEDFLFSPRGGNGKVPIKTDSDESFVRAVADVELNKGITDRRHKVVFHSLRHTFCSWLAKVGIPLFTIGELVGHSSVEMTKRYSHLCPDTARSAAEKIGPMLQQARGKAVKECVTADHSSSASESPDTSE